MKQLLQKLTVILLLVSATSLTAWAQTPDKGKATIADNMVIRLDTESPLVSDYSFSISAIAFKDAAAAERFFSLCRDNLMTYTVDYAAKVATVHLMLAYTEPRGWGITEYNEYFAKVGERYRSTLEVVNE